MNMVNFEQIAESCVKKYQEGLDKNVKHLQTLYVAISKDDDVTCSLTPSILKDAYRCILIHKCNSSVYPNVYRINYISEKGGVTNGFIDKDYYISVKPDLHVQPYSFYLILENSKYDILFSFKIPFEDKLQKIWNIYCKVKDVKSKEELILLKKIIGNEKKQSEIKAELDSAYHLLDELNNKYRKLLDDIKSLVE